MDAPKADRLTSGLRATRQARTAAGTRNRAPNSKNPAAVTAPTATQTQNHPEVRRFTSLEVGARPDNRASPFCPRLGRVRGSAWLSACFERMLKSYKGRPD